MNSLEYNTERKKLIIPEYGRHVHQMVDQAVSVKDKVERNNIAKAIIGVMGNLNPHNANYCLSYIVAGFRNYCARYGGGLPHAGPTDLGVEYRGDPECVVVDHLIGLWSGTGGRRWRRGRYRARRAPGFVLQ